LIAALLSGVSDKKTANPCGLAVVIDNAERRRLIYRLIAVLKPIGQVKPCLD
jgi:hypothetical protein